jgi:hypothetical protein
MASMKFSEADDGGNDDQGPTFGIKHACQVLKDEKYTDWVIECESARFPVHRLSLYYKSGFFRAAMDNHFKEKQKGVLKIGEAKPRIVGLVILHCYTNTISRPALEKAWPKVFTSGSIKDEINDQVRDICDLYQLADRLMLPELKLQAADFFIDRWLNSVAVKSNLKANETLEYCYKALQEEDELRSALSTVVFHQSRPGDALTQMIKKHDRIAFISLTISSEYRNGNGGPRKTLRRLLLAAQSRA